MNKVHRKPENCGAKSCECMISVHRGAVTGHGVNSNTRCVTVHWQHITNDTYYVNQLFHLTAFQKRLNMINSYCHDQKIASSRAHNSPIFSHTIHTLQNMETHKTNKLYSVFEKKVNCFPQLHHKVQEEQINESHRNRKKNR